MQFLNVLTTHILLAGLLLTFPTYAQNKQNTTQTEVRTALKVWNETARKRDLKAFMNLFDSTPNIILAGSDSGEIFKGKEQISQWVSSLFVHNSFEWDMKRIEIDNYQNCAWVFMDGSMIVTNDNGKKNKTPYRFTGVLLKRNGGWKWRLFDGSIPKSE